MREILRLAQRLRANRQLARNKRHRAHVEQLAHRSPGVGARKLRMPTSTPSLVEIDDPVGRFDGERDIRMARLEIRKPRDQPRAGEERQRADPQRRLPRAAAQRAQR